MNITVDILSIRGEFAEVRACGLIADFGSFADFIADLPEETEDGPEGWRGMVTAVFGIAWDMDNLKEKNGYYVVDGHGGCITTSVA